MTDTVIAAAGTTQTPASATVADTTTTTPAASTTAPVTDPAPAAATSLAGGDDAATQQAATDTAAADAATKAAADAAKADTTQTTIGAPEAYDLKAPEGTVLEAGVIAKFSEVAKTLNLSQTAAQSIIENLAPTIAAEQAAKIASFRADLVAQVKADKEIGGDKLDANLAIVKKAVEAFDTPDKSLRTLLNTSGLGDHPAVIRAFLKIGNAISEDNRVVTGGKQPTEGDKTLAQKMYGK